MLAERPTDHHELLTAGDVAQRLAISKSYVYRLMWTGEITSVKVGRLRRVRPDDLDHYIAERTQRADD